jgi:short-subunit dehydrogenase
MPAVTPPLALITGAASGMGRQFAVALAEAGHRLILVDINRPGLDATLAALPEPARASARTFTVDIGSAEAVQQMIAALAGDITSLDLLINCAAILGAGSFVEQPLGEFAKVVQVDLMGTVHMIHSTLPWLRKARGQIVNLASTASLHGWPLLAAYSAAKGAIENYSEAIRPELAQDGIGLLTVFPLLVDTPLLSQQSDLPPILKGGRISADEVVQKTLRAAARRQARLYVPWTARLVALIHGVSPPLLDWWGKKAGLRARGRP